MMKLKRMILNFTAVMVLALAAVPVAAGPAYAACPNNNTAKGQVLQGLGDTGSDCSDQQVNSTIGTVVNIMSYAVGIASVIMIAISGFKYITSGGEQGRVANAKNSLIYAIVGLAVAALAQFLIHFVLYQSTKT